MLDVARARRDAIMPRLEARQVRALDREAEPAPGVDADRDVGDGELRAGEIIGLPVLEPVLEDAPDRDALGEGLVERRLVTLFRRRADIAEEQRGARAAAVRELPVHPALDEAALRRVLGIEPVGAARGAEIAQDRVRFPDHRAAVLDGRHAAVGIHRAIGGVVVAAELAAPIDALVRLVDLGAEPQHLHYVRRAGPAPDLQQATLPSLLPAILPRRAARRKPPRGEVGYSSPSSSFASSLMRSRVQGGVQVSLTRASVTPSTAPTASFTWSGSAPATGHAGVVSVISI